jgi:predicted nucleic acid-binding protein
VIVVSDTSPIHYLLLIGEQDILPRLFGEVYTPPSVIEELRHARAPEIVRRWAAQPPDWLRVKSPVGMVRDPRLGRGEAEALMLAHELGNVAVMIDDLAGRRVAMKLGLPTRSTLGVLDLAADNGLLDPLAALDRLLATTFRASPTLVKAFQDKHRQRS